MADDSKTAKPGNPAADPHAGEPAADPHAGEPATEPRTGASAAEQRTGEPAADPLTGDPLAGAELIKGDQLDPELIVLPRPKRRRIGPITALCVAILCGYIMGKLYDDLRFSRQSVSPDSYGSVAELLANGRPEQFVRVHAVPDRTFAMKVAHSVAEDGFRLAPVQGTDGKLWLMIGGDSWTAGIRYEEVYEGRLRMVEDLPFVESLRSHVRTRGPEPRYVPAQAVKAALASKGSPGDSDAATATVRAPGGDSVAMAADTPVRISALAENLARVHAVLTERLTNADAVTQALVDAGLAPPGIKPQPGPSKDSLVYILPVPGGAPAATDKLRQAELFSMRAEPIHVAHATTWGKLADGGEALLVDGKPVPWSSFEWVTVDVPRELPAGARVLLAQESPDSYWYVLPLFALLGLSGVLFLWAFGRSLWLSRTASRDTSDAAPTPA